MRDIYDQLSSRELRRTRVRRRRAQIRVDGPAGDRPAEPDLALEYLCMRRAEWLSFAMPTAHLTHAHASSLPYSISKLTYSRPPSRSTCSTTGSPVFRPLTSGAQCIHGIDGRRIELVNNVAGLQTGVRQNQIGGSAHHDDSRRNSQEPSRERKSSVISIARTPRREIRLFSGLTASSSSSI